MCEVRGIDLPVIDVSDRTLALGKTRRATADRLIDCFSSVGFCLITGIEGYDAEELLKWTKWFHDEVPEDIKVGQLATKAFNPENDNLYRGYFPLVEGALSYKKGYDFGPDIPDEGVQEGNPFRQKTPRLKMPGQEDTLKEFYKVIYKHHAILHRKSDVIMSLLAEAGGERPDFFDQMFSEFPMHTFRPICYPKRVTNIPKGANLPDGRIISTPAHQDSGFLTLLQTFGFPGLEIEVDGTWYAVHNKPDTLVVNLGEQMTTMSNGRFRATIHRVIDIGRTRYSVPFFYEPNPEANINIKLPKGLLPPKTEKSKKDEELDFYPFGAFLLNKLPIYAEYAALCDNLPDWMREKYLKYDRPRDCWATSNGIEVDGASFDTKKKRKPPMKRADTVY